MVVEPVPIADSGVLAQPGQLPGLIDHLGDGGGRRLGNVGEGHAFQQVVIFMECQGNLSKMAWSEPDGEGQFQVGPELRRFQRPVNPIGPGFLEGQIALNGVHRLERRGQVGFQGTLAQDGAGEAVQRLNDRPVQVCQGALDPAPFRFAKRGVGSELLQPLPDPVPQLGRRGFGEGDDGGPVQGGLAGGRQGQHPVHQAGGLTGSGSGLNEQGLVQRFPDTLPVCFVPGHESHGHGVVSPDNSRYPASWGWPFFLVQRVSFLEGHTGLKSQKRQF